MKELNVSTNIPKCLNADDIQAILKLSRAGVYTLMHREDFPTIRIGTRILIPVDAYKEWLNKNASKK